MSSFRTLTTALANAFVAGQMDVDELVQRGSHVLGRRWRWLRPLARRVVEANRAGIRPRREELQQFLLFDRGLLQAWTKHHPPVVQPISRPPTMCPVEPASDWPVVALNSPGALANWLELSPRDLDWFAETRFWATKHQTPRLQHYRYRVLPKRWGVRLIEAPKPRLKAIQRRILTDILNHVPPHPAAHGFRPGGSIQTFAQPHAGQAVVIKIDLQDFFPSIRIARVQALFRTLGYPEKVADLLAALCTNSAPYEIWEEMRGNTENVPSFQATARLYAHPHLPQGAPTSPALANLCAYRLDCRLVALAKAAGAIYTRYADDLAFSGGELATANPRQLDAGTNFTRAANRFHIHACAVVLEEGFAVHHRKTRIMRQSTRQQLAGMVVNQHVNIRRSDFDRLKATLTNCIRFGLESQNRTGQANFRSHLQGRVAFVEMINPAKGHKLRELLGKIP